MCLQSVIQMKILSPLLSVLIAVLSVPVSAAPVPDFEPDGDVDFADLAVLAQQWLDTQDLSADIYPAAGDGIVNMLDFAEFAKHWLLSPPMALILGGQFEMGDHYNLGGPDEKPVHTVYLDPFYISTTLVTNRQYCDFLNAVKSLGLIELRGGTVYVLGQDQPFCDIYPYDSDSRISWDGSAFTVLPGKADHPVLEVSWFGAAVYCGFYGYRLPTEAEWEYAARAGLKYFKYPWGNNPDPSKANWWDSGDPFESGSYPWTTPVTYYPPNAYGLHDMAGNLWQWCSDRYSPTYYGISPYENPQGPASGTYRVLRGASWFNWPAQCRSASRNGTYPPDYRGRHAGFRLARDF